jgi:ribosomal protection tetracycline resistance protein
MRVRAECPAAAAGAVLATLARLGGSVLAPAVGNETALIEGLVPAGRVHAFRRDVTRITSGEGVVEADFDGYRPVPGRPPTRPRTMPNPLNRKSYFLATMRHRPARGGEYS